MCGGVLPCLEDLELPQGMVVFEKSALLPVHHQSRKPQGWFLRMMLCSVLRRRDQKGWKVCQGRRSKQGWDLLGQRAGEELGEGLAIGS